ncbi:MAG TPA: hypothetical protein VGR07_16680, partial [Thermoanaerobaculia bacterium]|nr:hypothetical protein [Thermoanaerobaculia bacterium]
MPSRAPGVACEVDGMDGMGGGGGVAGDGRSAAGPACTATDLLGGGGALSREASTGAGRTGSGPLVGVADA